MDSGRGASLRMRAGLAAMVVPLVLLAGVPALAWHQEPAGDHECTVCHSGRQTADLTRPVELVASRVLEVAQREDEAPRVPSGRSLRQPARAPPT